MMESTKNLREPALPSLRHSARFDRAGRVVEGWYWVLPAVRLKPGRVRAVNLMGRELAVYRGRDGQVAALDAYCPHMGAHLAEGRVEGDALRCFFHNWRFDRRGRCTDIPCLARPPAAGIGVHSWPVREKYGLIWVWTGPEPRHEVPEVPELQDREVVAVLGNRFRKKCHPHVVMVNAIDEQHFHTVHRLPGSILRMQAEVVDRHNVRFRNTGRVPRDTRLGRWIARFYRNTLTYSLSYWYGCLGSVTFGPDFLNLHLMFALRPSAGGETEGQTVLLTRRRRGPLGWLVVRLALALTALGGRYFAHGDTRVFQTIRFDLKTPIAADRSVIAFFKHLEGQAVVDWGTRIPTTLESASPPPLRGRDREGGGTGGASDVVSLRSPAPPPQPSPARGEGALCPDRIPVRTLLDAPHGEAALARVVRGFARRRGLPADTPDGRPYWDAGYFGLDRLTLFRQTPIEQQQEVLARLSRGLLAESYFIEKAGLAFCAKMTLLSETTEERQIYSLIGADEAVHLHWVSAYADPAIANVAPDPFTGFIAGLVEHGERASLAYLLQVVLEGWGIHHYRSLAAGCRDSELKAVLARIARDEGLHHAGGLALSDAEAVKKTQRAVEEALAAFLEMVRSGPQTVVAVVEWVRGGLDRAGRVRAFAELEAAGDTRRKLARLRTLIAQPGMEAMAQALERRGLFTPCTPAECADRRPR